MYNEDCIFICPLISSYWEECQYTNGPIQVEELEGFVCEKINEIISTCEGCKKYKKQLKQTIEISLLPF